MSAADRPDSSTPAASDIATACREAGFVRLIGTADGDALAAIGILGRALRAADVPFQASVASVPCPGETDADVTLTVGTDGGDFALTRSTTSVPAYAAARALTGEDTAPVLALAGVIASGAVPGEAGHGLLEAAMLERRPGVGIPVADPAEGIAHSTFVHVPTSGDIDETRAAIADTVGNSSTADEQAHRTVASFLALTALRGTPPRASTAVGRMLHPYVSTACPFETVAGYADVLEAVAQERPGTGVALALGHDVMETALSAWRKHGARVHKTLHTADTSRHDGLFVVRAGHGARLGTIARLARDYQSPEPMVLALGGESHTDVAVAGSPGVTDMLRRALPAAAEAGTINGRGGVAHARLEDGSTSELVTALTEVL